MLKILMHLRLLRLALKKAKIECSFSQELRIEGETDRTTWLAGLYYLDFTTESYGIVGQACR